MLLKVENSVYFGCKTDRDRCGEPVLREWSLRQGAERSPGSVLKSHCETPYRAVRVALLGWSRELVALVCPDCS